MPKKLDIIGNSNTNEFCELFKISNFGKYTPIFLGSMYSSSGEPAVSYGLLIKDGLLYSIEGVECSIHDFDGQFEQPCGCIDPDNRQKQALFVCQVCGHTENADTNAGKVLAKRGIDAILTGKWQPRKVKRVQVRRGECSEVKPVEPVLAVADKSVLPRNGRRSRKVRESEVGQDTPTITQD